MALVNCATSSIPASSVSLIIANSGWQVGTDIAVNNTTGIVLPSSGTSYYYLTESPLYRLVQCSISSGRGSVVLAITGNVGVWTA